MNSLFHPHHHLFPSLASSTTSQPPLPQSINLYPLKIEIVVKNIPANKAPGLGAFTGKIYQNLKKQIKPILHKLFFGKIKQETHSVRPVLTLF